MKPMYPIVKVYKTYYVPQKWYFLQTEEDKIWMNEISTDGPKQISSYHEYSSKFFTSKIAEII